MLRQPDPDKYRNRRQDRRLDDACKFEEQKRRKLNRRRALRLRNCLYQSGKVDQEKRQYTRDSRKPKNEKEPSFESTLHEVRRRPSVRPAKVYHTMQ